MIDKREFLIEKVKNRESISSSKTLRIGKRLSEASKKKIEKLYDQYQNPTPVRVNKQEALELRVRKTHMSCCN